MNEYKQTGSFLPAQMCRQMHLWLSTTEGKASQQMLQRQLVKAPSSLVVLGQSDFWRQYQSYLLAAHSRRKAVGELKMLLQESGFECRTSNKGDWCGLVGMDEPYWSISFGMLSPNINAKSAAVESVMADNPWVRLGLEPGNPSEVRAEIFRAFVLEKYGQEGEDNVLVCSSFKAESGMSFTDFFGGLSVKKIKLETWGEKHCIWVSFADAGKAKTKVVPMHVHDCNEFHRLPPSGYAQLVDLAHSKVPEKIGFSDIAERFGVSRETVLRSYCAALNSALNGWKQDETTKSIPHVQKSMPKQIPTVRAVCGYFLRLGRAFIGRSGPSRSRYLKKWVQMLQGSSTQDAKLVLTNGRLVVGALLDATDDCFMVKIGSETELIPIAEICQVKGVDRAVVQNSSSQVTPLVGSIGSVDTGYVSWWGEDKGFGFVKAQSQTYFFDRGLIYVDGLAEGLRTGYRHQRVEFSVVSAAQGSFYARVKICKVLHEGTQAAVAKHAETVEPRSADGAAYLLSCLERDYVGYMLKSCDFHGLESAGIHNYEDISADQSQDRIQHLKNLISSHKTALEGFWGDRLQADRKRYNSAEYNHEMIRFQLTGTGLLLWAGEDEKSRSAWRLYLYRMLQEVLFSFADYEFETLVAFLILITRTLTRKDSYWHTVIPMLFVSVSRKASSEELHRVIEDDDYRNHQASEVYLDQENDKKLIALFRALRLGDVFTLVADWLRACPQGEEPGNDYGAFLSRTQTRIAESLATLDREGLTEMKVYFQELGIPYVGRLDYRSGFVRVIDSALDYVGAVEYRDFVKAHGALLSAVHEFEASYVREEVSLPVIDIYYPYVCEIMQRVDADFVGRSCQKIELQLVHAASEKYYADDGEIELKLKLVSVNRDAPSICEIRLAVADCEHDDYFPGPLNGGDDHVFTMKLDLDDAHVRSGEGSLLVQVGYKYADGDDTIIDESFEISYMVDEGTFEEVPNPYLNFVKKPATGSMFVGREKLLDEIVTIFQSDCGGQGYVLYGQRRSGKTSVYENVKGRLGEEGFVYTKISAQAIEEDIGLAGFSRALEDSIGNELENGMLYVPDASVRADDYLGRIRAISRAIASGKKGSGPRTWVIGFDEFTSLYDYYHSARGDERLMRKEKVRTFLRELKALLEERVFNLLIIGQESIVQLQSDFPNEFAVLHLHRLTYLTEEDVKRLADNPIMKIRDNGERVTRYKGTSLHRLFYLTAGQPFFTQMFCRTLVDYLNDNQLHDITAESVDAVERMLCEGDARIPDAQFEPFVNLMADVDEDEVVRLYYKIAEATEEDYDWVPLSDFSEAQIPIVHLLDARGIVRMTKDNVQLRMGLFTSWLRCNPGRTRMSFGGKDIGCEN